MHCAVADRLRWTDCSEWTQKHVRVTQSPSLAVAARHAASTGRPVRCSPSLRACARSIGLPCDNTPSPRPLLGRRRQRSAAGASSAQRGCAAQRCAACLREGPAWLRALSIVAPLAPMCLGGAASGAAPCVSLAPLRPGRRLPARRWSLRMTACAAAAPVRHRVGAPSRHAAADARAPRRARSPAARRCLPARSCCGRCPAAPRRVSTWCARRTARPPQLPTPRRSSPPCGAYPPHARTRASRAAARRCADSCADGCAGVAACARLRCAPAQAARRLPGGVCGAPRHAASARGCPVAVRARGASRRPRASSPRPSRRPRSPRTPRLPARRRRHAARRGRRPAGARMRRSVRVRARSAEYTADTALPLAAAAGNGSVC